MSTSSILITGGARRIGAEIARRLHHEGLDIALHYMRSADEAELLQAELNQQRENSCRLYRADLASPPDLAKLCERVIAAETALAGLVNNASVYEKLSSSDAQTSDWDRIVATNLQAPWELSRQLHPTLAQNSGAIINILDAHSQIHQRGYALYDLSKNALTSLTRSLAVEFAPQVRVNGVAPGAILWPEDPEGEHHSGDQQSFLARIPMQRLGDPADIASAVHFLLCSAPYVTGQVLAVDGGRSIGA